MPRRLHAELSAELSSVHPAESKDNEFYCSAAFPTPRLARECLREMDGRENIPSKISRGPAHHTHPSGSVCLRPTALLLQNKMSFILLGLYTQENQPQKWGEPQEQLTQTSKIERAENTPLIINKVNTTRACGDMLQHCPKYSCDYLNDGDRDIRGTHHMAFFPPQDFWSHCTEGKPETVSLERRIWTQVCLTQAPSIELYTQSL